MVSRRVPSQGLVGTHTHGARSAPAVQLSPGGQLPRQAGNRPPHGNSVVVVVEDVDVVVMVGVDVVVMESVDVVVLEVEVVVGHAAQQVPVAGIPPRASQSSVEGRTRQRSASPGATLRQATASRRPHVDRLAQRTMPRRQADGSPRERRRSFTTRDTHFT